MKKLNLLFKVLLHLLAFIGLCLSIVMMMASAIYLNSQGDYISEILGWTLLLLTLGAFAGSVFIVGRWIGGVIRYFRLFFYCKKINSARHAPES